MKRATLALAIALTLPASVWAQEPPPPSVIIGDVGSGNNSSANASADPNAASDAAAASNLKSITTTIYEEAAQTAYSTGGTVGKCLAAYGVGIQARGFGISFGTNRALKKCQGRALAAQLMLTGHPEDREMGRSILHTYYRDWRAEYKPRGPNRVCKTKDSCYDIEAVELEGPES